jgi:hypothetical protein
MLRMVEWNHPFCSKLPFKWGGGGGDGGRGRLDTAHLFLYFLRLEEGEAPAPCLFSTLNVQIGRSCFFSSCLVLEGWADRITEAEGRNIDEDAIRKMESRKKQSVREEQEDSQLVD